MRSAMVGLGVLLACLLWACSKPMTFEEEFSLSVRAGRGALSSEEKADLLKANHPILMQMGDPGTKSLIEGFAALPDASHRQLLAESFLKWKYAELHEGHQRPFLTLVEANLALAEQQGTQPHPGFSVEGLLRAEVGYAVVEIDSDKSGKVVSLFILWPELSDPTWVTVANAKLAGTQPYFQAHLQRLPMLGYMGASALP